MGLILFSFHPRNERVRDRISNSVSYIVLPEINEWRKKKGGGERNRQTGRIQLLYLTVSGGNIQTLYDDPLLPVCCLRQT